MATKKGSKSAPAEVNYNIKDIVLAKVRGYPAWPAMIVDPDAVPKDVAREKPPTKKMKFYCVRFFPAGDHTWSLAKDLSRLLPHEIEAFINEPSKKSGDLKKGYEIALNPEAWEKDFNKRLQETARAEEEADESVDQLDDSEDGGDDELDAEGEGVDGEGSTTKKKKSSDAGKKRKRESAAADDKKKKRKSAESSAKRRPVVNPRKKKLSAEHIESEDEKADADSTPGVEDADGVGEKVGGAKKSKPRKGKKDGPSSERPNKRSRKDKTDDDEAVEDAALANDPEAQRVKEWRHKLQRGFLTSKSPPVAEDMPTYDQIFSTVEAYEGFTIEYLSFSKIGKVMRRIANLSDIPRDSEFKFKDRATTLVQKWQSLVGESSTQPNGSVSVIDGEKKDDGEAKDAVAEDELVVNGTTEIKTNGKTPSEDPVVPPVTNGDSEMKPADAEPTPVASVEETKKAEEAEKDDDSDAMDTSAS